MILILTSNAALAGRMRKQTAGPQKIGSEVIVYHGNIGESPIQVASFQSEAAVTEAVLQRIFDRDAFDAVVMANGVDALVPYLQQGDIVIADRLLASAVAIDGPLAQDGDLRTAIAIDPEVLARILGAYDDLFAGKSNRPQMVLGTVLSGDKAPIDKTAMAWLNQKWGVIASDRVGMTVAAVCDGRHIPFLLIGLVSDNYFGAVEDGPTPSGSSDSERMEALVARFIALWPSFAVPAQAGR